VARPDVQRNHLALPPTLHLQHQELLLLAALTPGHCSRIGANRYGFLGADSFSLSAFGVRVLGTCGFHGLRECSSCLPKGYRESRS
jgi:hypothetical protein